MMSVVAGRIKIDFEFRYATGKELSPVNMCIKQHFDTFTPDYSSKEDAEAAIERIKDAVKEAMLTQEWKRK